MALNNIRFNHPTTMPDRATNRPQIQPSNYIWKSPHGEAFPGWQHQLILHLLAVDQTWNGPYGFDFTVVTAWLMQHWPSYMVTPTVLGTIAWEYVFLPEDDRATYRNMIPSLPHSREVKFNAFTSISDTVGTAAMLDSNLFRTAETDVMASYQHHSISTAAGVQAGSAPGQPKGSTGSGSQNVMRKDFHSRLPKVPDTVTSSGHFLPGSSDSRQSDFDDNFRFSPTSNVTFDTTFTVPSSPTKILPTAVMPPAPHKSNSSPFRSFEELSSAQGTSTPSRTPKTSFNVIDKLLFDPNKDNINSQPHNKLGKVAVQLNLISKHVEGIKIGTNTIDQDEEELAHATMAPQGHNQATSNKKPSTENESTEEEAVTTDVQSSKPSIPSLDTDANQVPSSIPILPRPDFTKYVHIAGEDWIIPYSEADAFAAWFNPQVDPVPEKIEGYYWYCDKCYNSEQQNPGKNVRGRYSAKKSFEKHIHSVHKVKKWRPVLPEPKREQNVVDLGPQEILGNMESHADEDKRELAHSTMETTAEDRANDDEIAGKLDYDKEDQIVKKASTFPPSSLSPSTKSYDDFSYKPANTKRKLFEKELEESLVSPSIASTSGRNKSGFRFADIDPRMVSTPTKQGTDKASVVPEKRRVAFAAQKDVKIFHEESPPGKKYSKENIDTQKNMPASAEKEETELRSSKERLVNSLKRKVNEADTGRRLRSALRNVIFSCSPPAAPRPEERIAQLQTASILRVGFPSPDVLVAYGPEEVAKVETIQHALTSQNIDYVVVNCRECLSQRHLLSKIFSRCVKSLGSESALEEARYDRLDSTNALVGNLKKLLQARKERLIVILACADQQRGATTTLFPALARLGDSISCLSLILTSSAPQPLALHKAGIPYLYFPPFTRSEAIQLLLRDPPPLLPDPLPEYAPSIKQEKLHNIYNQFATVVYDTLIAPTTNSIVKYRQTIKRLWPRFVWPLVSGEKPAGRSTNNEWDFARLLSRNRILFQSEGEESLQERLISVANLPSTFEELVLHKAEQDERLTIQPVSSTPTTSKSPFKPVQPPLTKDHAPQGPPLLKFFSTLLLLSAYLASHTHPKHDIVLFSRLSNASSTNRRKKKYLARSRAGGITKTPTKSPSKKDASAPHGDDDNDNDTFNTTPSKKRKTSTKDLGLALPTTSTPKKERADRSMRAIFEKTSNIARPFILERAIAILRAIHPDGIKMGKGIADRVYAELAELERLRLVVRADERGKVAVEDILEEQWKCVVGREWVVEAGRVWGVGIEGWEVE
ncbi:hypothetical protein LTS08_008162 [Lithohypha guttulata]|nr:hypothetical protein LTS08_008162 [Lithohypha guttulata]